MSTRRPSRERLVDSANDSLPGTSRRTRRRRTPASAVQLRVTLAILTCVGLLVISAPAFSQTVWTAGGDGISWEDGNNWDTGIPPNDPGMGAHLDNVAGFTTITTSTAIALEFFWIDPGVTLELGNT